MTWWSSAAAPRAVRPPSCWPSAGGPSPCSTRARSRARRSAGSTSRPRPRACSIAWACSRTVDAAGAQPLHGMRIVAPDGTRARRRVSDRRAGGAGTATTRSRCRARCSTASCWSGRGPCPVDVRERHRVTGLIVEGGRVRGVQAEDADGRAGRACGAGWWWAPTGAPPWWRTRSGSCGRTGCSGWRSSSTSSGIEGLRRPRRDLRGSARLLHPEPGRAGDRQPEPGGAARAREAVPRAARGLLRGAAAVSSATCRPRLAGHEGRGAADGHGAARVSSGGAARRRRAPRGRRGRLLRPVHRRGALHRAALRRAAGGGGAPGAHRG